MRYFVSPAMPFSHNIPSIGLYGFAAQICVSIDLSCRRTFSNQLQDLRLSRTRNGMLAQQWRKGFTEISFHNNLRCSHNPKVSGSNPDPATKIVRDLGISLNPFLLLFLPYFYQILAAEADIYRFPLFPIDLDHHKMLLWLRYLILNENLLIVSFNYGT